MLGESAWDHGPLVDELVRQVAAEIGEADGVLAIDPSAHGKKGNDSLGVEPQWNGRLGTIDNCQGGIHLEYASRKKHALVDERLFLPEEWADVGPCPAPAGGGALPVQVPGLGPQPPPPAAPIRPPAGGPQPRSEGGGGRLLEGAVWSALDRSYCRAPTARSIA